jgi:hypothetical protein
MSEGNRINLRRFALEFRQGVLGDLDSAFMCGAVCYPLASLLQLQGIEVKVMYGVVSHVNCYCYHVWLKLPDGRVLDPTADQFCRPNGRRMPRVYLGNKPRWYLRAQQREQPGNE